MSLSVYPDGRMGVVAIVLLLLDCKLMDSGQFSLIATLHTTMNNPGLTPSRSWPQVRETIELTHGSLTHHQLTITLHDFCLPGDTNCTRMLGSARHFIP